MSMNKRRTVRGIARRTGLTHEQSRQAVEALIALWSEALVDGERIAIDNFLILKVNLVRRHGNLTTAENEEIQIRLQAKAGKLLKNLVTRKV